MEDEDAFAGLRPSQGDPAGSGRHTPARGEIAGAGRPAMVAGSRGGSRYDRQRWAAAVAHGGGSGANPAGERLDVPAPTRGGDRRRRRRRCRRRGRGRVHNRGVGTVLLSMCAGPEVPGLNLIGTHAEIRRFCNTLISRTASGKRSDRFKMSRSAADGGRCKRPLTVRNQKGLLQRFPRRGDARDVIRPNDATVLFIYQH